MDSTTKLIVELVTKSFESGSSKIADLSGKLTQLERTMNRGASTTGKAAAANEQNAKAMDKAGDSAGRAAKKQEGYFYHIAKTTIQSALINKLFLEMVDVMGKAVEQVDALNNFPKTMASMGQSAEDANKSMGVLRDYVGLIGADLGEATSMVTRFTGALNSVTAATAVYQGINNALIAGDTTAEERTNALIQFSQALERGKPDIREWNTLTQSMAQQLNLVAEELGYASAINLGEALRNGEENMGRFITEFTKLSTGTGVIAQQAATRLNGLQFAFNIMKNTMIQGVAAIVNAFGRANLASFFTFLTQVIQVLAGWAMIAVRAIIWLINVIRALFGAGPLQLVDDIGGSISDVGGSIEDASDAADGLGDGLGGASKSAKELAKSLAPFDKMNVLPDKDSGSGGGGGGSGGGGGGAGGIDPGAISGLGDLLGDVTGKLKEVSFWAKLVAGFLATLAAFKMGNALFDALDKQITRFQKLGKVIDSTKDKLAGLWADAGKDTDSFTKKVSKMPGLILTSFGGIGRFLTNPYVLAAAAVLAVAGTILYLYNRNEDFKKGFDAVWKPIIDTLTYTYNFIKTKISEAIDSIRVQFDKWMEIPSFKWLVDTIVAIGKWLSDMLDKIGLAGSWWEKLGKIAGAVVLSIIGGIALLIGGPIALLIAAIGAVVGVVWWLIESAKNLWHNWEDTWNKINEIVQKAWQWLQDTWDGVTEYFVGIWHGIYEAVIGPLNNIKLAFTEVKDGVVGTFTDAKEAVESVIGTLATAVSEQWDKLKLKWYELVDTIKNSEMVKDLKEKWDEFKTSMSENWDNLKTKWGELTDTIKNSDAAKTVQEKWEEVKDGLSSAWDGLKTSFSGIWDKITGKSDEAGDDVSDKWSTANDTFKSIKETIDEFKKSFNDAMDDLKEKLQPVVQTVKDFYENSVKPMLEKIKEWAEKTEILSKSLKVFGIIIATVVLAPIIILLATIALVVAAVLAIGFAILWVVTKFIEFSNYIIGGGLWEDIKNAASAVGEWLKEKFNEALEWIKDIFSKLPGWFADRWEDIKSALSAVGTWFKDKFQEAWNNLTTIFQALGRWFGDRWEDIKNALKAIGTWFKDKFNEAWKNLTAIFQGLGKWFTDRWNDLKNGLSGVGTWFRDKFREAWNNITSVFSGLWAWFRDNVWNKIVGIFSGIGSSIGDAVSGAFKGVVNGALAYIEGVINGAIRAINVAIRGFNKISPVNVSTISTISLPRLAKGGIIDSPTLALVGESGSEAVVPLENNTEWIEKLAAKINTSSGNSKQPVQLVVKIGEDEIASKIIELINEKTQMSGRNAIYV